MFTDVIVIFHFFCIIMLISTKISRPIFLYFIFSKILTLMNFVPSSRSCSFHCEWCCTYVCVDLCRDKRIPIMCPIVSFYFCLNFLPSFALFRILDWWRSKSEVLTVRIFLLNYCNSVLRLDIDNLPISKYPFQKKKTYQHSLHEDLNLTTDYSRCKLEIFTPLLSCLALYT